MMLGMVGLGRMGANLLRRAMAAGIGGAGFDRDAAAVAALVAEGARGADSLPALVALLPAPRTVWVMLPAGEITEAALRELHALLAPGDTIIEGGNSLYKDSARRAAEAAAKGLRYLDVGTSGGVWGLQRGYCLMIGGEDAAVRDHDALWRALAPGEAAAPPTPGAAGDGRAAQGYVHCGPSGAGHYAKMVHNGIEYGMMQAVAEGLDLLRRGPFPAMPLPEVTEAWRRGSVVSSWLLDLTAQALAADPELKEYGGVVSDSGEGRWTVDAAVEHAVPAPVLAAALFARFRSRGVENFADKALSAMRKGFGGHLEPKAPDA
ncbi:phosphogluconate dehydrogenase (NAD(+)-dependent, decarboxylating) [Roseococcus sp. DSY-14]|uniref:phosphogluconate dehydrogenase (NAD(+)-dependent, decarboxylating) n=1 Tax=Roseococcus sp. DSY-14 TaxID=3369650 RepID=UPI00387AFBEF